MGDPVDYLVCRGSSDIRDGETDEIAQVILLDIKTGNAKLNKTQRRIRDAVQAGRVKFMTYNPDTRKMRIWGQDGQTKTE